MNQYKVLIAHNHSSIEILHSLVPFYLLSDKSLKYKFQFIDYKFLNKKEIKADLIILTRKYHSFDVSIEENKKKIIEDIKKYKNQFNKVIYFDDSAAVSHILYFILPYVDSYWVRGLLNDKSEYEKKLYGGRTFSNYYYEKYEVKDERFNFSPNFKYKNTKKIKIAWNIGIGCFPTSENTFLNRNYFIFRKLCCILSFLSLNFFLKKIISSYITNMKKELKKELTQSFNNSLISARFSYEGYTNSVGFNRKLALRKIFQNNKFIKGKLPSWQYIKECSKVMAILSPFGWGEICYRDFEAILSKSLLVKPDMNHLDTWPNIYHDEYYFKLDWDFNNIRNLESFLHIENKEVYCKINKSSLLYLKALEKCESRAKNMLDQILK